MNPDIKVIIYEEKSILKKLLSLLDEQYDCIINKDAIQMDKIASKLDEASKELAKIEIQRRNIMGSEASMRETISLCDRWKYKKCIWRNSKYHKNGATSKGSKWYSYKAKIIFYKENDKPYKTEQRYRCL